MSDVATVQDRLESGRDAAFRVEERGLEPVPDGERHGHPRELFLVWAAALADFVSFLAGAILVGLGLGVAVTTAQSLPLFGDDPAGWICWVMLAAMVAGCIAGGRLRAPHHHRGAVGAGARVHARLHRARHRTVAPIPSRPHLVGLGRIPPGGGAVRMLVDFRRRGARVDPSDAAMVGVVASAVLFAVLVRVRPGRGPRTSAA